MDLILTFSVMLAVCISIALLIARRQFHKWRREDMKERGVDVIQSEMWLDQDGAMQGVRNQIEREYDRQFFDIPHWNREQVAREMPHLKKNLTSCRDYSQLSRLGRVLHILNLDMVVFHKKYRNAVLKALKQAGAIKAVLVLLGTTIAHFAVVCLFVVVTLPVLGVCSVVPKGAFIPLRDVNASVMRFFSHML